MKDLALLLVGVALFVAALGGACLLLDYQDRCAGLNSECDYSRFTLATGFACCPDDALDQYKRCRRMFGGAR